MPGIPKSRRGQEGVQRLNQLYAKSNSPDNSNVTDLRKPKPQHMNTNLAGQQTYGRPGTSKQIKPEWDNGHIRNTNT